MIFGLPDMEFVVPKPRVSSPTAVVTQTHSSVPDQLHDTTLNTSDSAFLAPSTGPLSTVVSPASPLLLRSGARALFQQTATILVLSTLSTFTSVNLLPLGATNAEA